MIDADLGEVEARALGRLLASGKPLLLVLNRIDCWPSQELPALLASIRRRLPPGARHLEPLAVAAAPRQARIRPDGKVRSDPGPPQVAPLRCALIDLLEGQGEPVAGPQCPAGGRPLQPVPASLPGCAMGAAGPGSDRSLCRPQGHRCGRQPPAAAGSGRGTGLRQRPGDAALSAVRPADERGRGTAAAGQAFRAERPAGRGSPGSAGRAERSAPVAAVGGTLQRRPQPGPRRSGGHRPGGPGGSHHPPHRATGGG